MFLGRWLNDGLSQVLAPDDNFEAQVAHEDTANSPFWQLVAPDKDYESRSRHGPPPSRSRLPKQASSSNVPPREAFQHKKAPSTTATMVQCQHCHGMTPITIPTTIPATPTTPQKPTISADKIKTDLEERVLEAAKGWAMSRRMPKADLDKSNRIFKWAASSINQKQTSVFQRYITDQPSLLHSRAHNLGETAPDGFTPLMAAAKHNHLAMAELIIKADPTTLGDTDLEGRRPVHIASVFAALDVIPLLNTPDVYGERAPLDLSGTTPYGCAKLSTILSAKRHRAQLDQTLFSPKDPCVRGRPTPHKQRTGSAGENAELLYGFAQMPGKRVSQEDAIGIQAQPRQLMVSVCDGHEDGGFMSRYLADNAWTMYSKQPEQLPMEVRWRETALAMDQQLKSKKRRGGSTGVFCLVNNEQIVVANVGDCRAILIQKLKVLAKPDNDSSGSTAVESEEESKKSKEAEQEKEKEESKQENEEKEKREGEPVLVEENKGGESSTKSFGVIPLSEDHKPSLPSEKQRIEGAGLKVKMSSYLDINGNLQNIHRADLGNGQSLAVSRAFGDFDYKGNTNFEVDQQAIVAIPDVMVCDRSENDMYIVLACDGVWDVLSNEEVAEFVVEHADKTVEKDESGVLAKVSDELVTHCLEKGSEDNMSVAIVALSDTCKRIAASGGGGEQDILTGKKLFR